MPAAKPKRWCTKSATPVNGSKFPRSTCRGGSKICRRVFENWPIGLELFAGKSHLLAPFPETWFVNGRGGAIDLPRYALIVNGKSQPLNRFPLSFPNREAASIKLGPGFEQTEINKKHLIIFRVIVPDSLYAYIDETGAWEKKPVEGLADTIDHTLTDWLYIDNDQGNRLKMFYGAIPSDDRFVEGCGLTPAWIAVDGEITSWRAVNCECYVDADPIEEFPEITAEISSDSTLSISWFLIKEADVYGVIIWNQQPTSVGFFDGIVFTAEFSADNLPSIVGTSLPPNHDYYIAVWANNWDTTEESGPCNLEYSYVMDLEHFDSGRPTKVQQSSWGKLKASFE